MVAGTGALVRSQLGASGVGRETVDRLARWLLAAVAVDLIFTRFVVRLAIFIPKGEPWATAGAVLGRVGAATDALVAIVGLLLLGALLVRAGRLGRGADRAILVALSVVAAGGLALVYLPPSPAISIVLDLLVAAVALAAGIRVGREGGTPVVARIGLVSLALALALAPLGRLVDLAGLLAGATDGRSEAAAGLAIGALGQLAFVLGAAFVGLGGVVSRRPFDRSSHRIAVLGLVAALVVLSAGARAPAMWGALAIWSVGLGGTVPTAAVALALGLAVAGLPMLYRRAPALAIGASIVLLSGYGLAASGLVLAGLLGVVLARSDALADPVTR
ncbi:MAG: hypothetical protein Q7S35_04930 [Candidatus Limnocylindrales bacterium]|nr:hypothetical protein [Candidatus Limnocylindrales bacterium]